MKISNYRLTKFVAYSITASIILMIFAIIWSDQVYIDTTCVILSGVLLLLLLRLQCINYENSGNCITFRKYHPFTHRKFIPPFIELPQSSIQDFNFSKGLGISKLTLKVNSKRRKRTVVKMLLMGFTHSQNSKIESSLQTIRLKNNNQPFS